MGEPLERRVQRKQQQQQSQRAEVETERRRDRNTDKQTDERCARLCFSDATAEPSRAYHCACDVSLSVSKSCDDMRASQMRSRVSIATFAASFKLRTGSGICCASRMSAIAGLLWSKRGISLLLARKQLGRWNNHRMRCASFSLG